MNVRGLTLSTIFLSRNFKEYLRHWVQSAQTNQLEDAVIDRFRACARKKSFQITGGLFTDRRWISSHFDEGIYLSKLHVLTTLNLH